MATEVAHSCTDPTVRHSCRWTEAESDTEKGGDKTGGGMESITGRLKQWTTTGSGGRSTEQSGESTTASGTAMGAVFSGVKSTLGAAGEKMSEAASGIHEKVSETFGDFKSKTFGQ